jgi:hypothetical protein
MLLLPRHVNHGGYRDEIARMIGFKLMRAHTGNRPDSRSFFGKANVPGVDLNCAQS